MNKKTLHSFLFNSSLFTGKFAHVKNSCTPNFSVSVYFNLFNKRRIHRKNTLNSNIIRHFTNGESFIVTHSLDLNHNAFKYLYSFLIALTYFIVYRNGITKESEIILGLPATFPSLIIL